MAQLRPFFETKTSDEWVELLSGIDILKAKVNSYDDLFKDAQVQAIDAVRAPNGSIICRSIVCSGLSAAIGS